MKRLLVICAMLTTLLAPAALAVQPAGAVDIFHNCGSGSAGGTPSVCPNAQAGQSSKTNPIIDVLKVAIEVISFIVGAAAIITLVVSGIRFMVGGGDSSAVAGARTGVIYALVGIVVVALAQLIVVFVLDRIK